MEIIFRAETSGDNTAKFRAVEDELNKVAAIVQQNTYSDQLKVLSVTLYCMHPKFDVTFPPQRPKYYPKNSNAMHRGERIEKVAGTFEYELRLDFERYLGLTDIRINLAKDIIDSLKIIQAFKNIRLSTERKIEEDFRDAFQQIGWIDRPNN